MPEDRAARLDALNTATFAEHFRNIKDRGVADDPGSALHHAYRPGGGTLLDALRANAEAVYGEAPRPRTKG